MPYLEQTQKDALDDAAITACTSGHLNYLFTREILRYVENMGLSYRTINDIVGALESCKLEFYRRVAVPYENTKAKINGDVYGE